MYIYTDKECCGCDDKHEQIENAKYWLQHLIDLIYSKNPLEEAEIECALEELAHTVGMKIPEIEPQIIRKPRAKIEPINNMIEDWMNFNTKYLKSL